MTTHRPRVTLEELIVKYSTVSSREAPGVMRAACLLVEKNQGGPKLMKLVDFLIGIGSEVEAIEEDENLREEARRVLVRSVVSRPYGVFIDTSVARKVLDFFSSHEKHCALMGRDVTTLQSFLEKWWVEMCHCGTDPRPLEKSFLMAVINARHFEFFVDHEITEVVFRLYSCLFKGITGIDVSGSDYASATNEHIFAVCGVAIRQQDAEDQVWWAKDAALALLSLKAISACGRANVH